MPSTVPATGTSVGILSGSDIMTGTVQSDPRTGNDAVFTHYPYSSISISKMDLSALAGSVTNLPAGLDGLGFSLDCSGCDQFVTVMFDASTDKTERFEGISGNPPPFVTRLALQESREHLPWRKNWDSGFLMVCQRQQRMHMEVDQPCQVRTKKQQRLQHVMT